MNDIGAIILAAGMSKRMGQPKQFLNLHGKPLFRYSVETAVRSGLRPVIVVGGEHTKLLKEYIRDLPAEVIHNPNFATGMSSSLKVGVKAIQDKVSASFVFLADQPFIPVTVVNRLRKVYAVAKSKNIKIIRPRYAAVPGHPVLFAEDIFPDLLRIEGDRGANHVIRQHLAEVEYVDFDHSLWGVDIDTPEDWKLYISKRIYH
ncbi:4-diphosphocytidyl-2C-methyl-D-erythritol synthase [Caldalkalibacillus thermarum TA2.A1]|uniref:4-diphosphocytidyl-2C-methyl-D-erythritol synthase n=1 Tax=Caldalkalibacillus thermarum (strain TA2.A1) TaxID=986075 RepID=F5LAI1_CALTT|nr:nucleotidyltransferase family protein [Caldalkalibacillus thermarum]EGL81730.1 4-diphosphocytidyl-2C-methyl-D-erythritol synthase [Caldalkalibacillus thermarum TA2.A1]QZT33315.1 nucleotidyltransferase family protein [Caldalkalibacillus thermarum TA2.A1]